MDDRTTPSPGTLVVLSGLPGTGKTTVAAATAVRLDCTHLSVDVAEAAMWRCGVDRSVGSGVAAYEVVAAVAEVQLRAGRLVVVDAVNAVPEARATWSRVATAAGARLLSFECVLTDVSLHRARAEERDALEGFYNPSWEEIERRRAEYVEWPASVLRLDSSEPVDSLVRTVVGQVEDGRLKP
ncbi:AAA family ATPase [Stackebrandtia soli]|uniref:AAA family ATPase n=1 Tax=Stackebrandtia soli TaxID=1892856 RepID=UPI0039E842E9